MTKICEIHSFQGIGKESCPWCDLDSARVEIEHWRKLANTGADQVQELEGQIERLQKIEKAATELHAALSMNGNVIKCHNRLGDLLRETTKKPAPDPRDAEIERYRELEAAVIEFIAGDGSVSEARMFDAIQALQTKDADDICDDLISEALGEPKITPMAEKHSYEMSEPESDSMDAGLRASVTDQPADPSREDGDG